MKLPVFRSLSDPKLPGDFVAGLTVWAVLVPEALAYASIAGVSPVVGLYAAPGALILYAAFGSSRQLITGPMAATAALSAAIVGDLATQGASDYVQLTATLAITVWASRQTKTATDYYAGGRSFSGFQNGMAIGGDYMSAASFLGIAGIIALYGYDGFLYSIGFLVAWLVALLLVAGLALLSPLMPTKELRSLTASTRDVELPRYATRGAARPLLVYSRRNRF